MRNVYLVISSILIGALLGCATTQTSATKIGTNRYEISADSMTDPDGAFTKKAQEVCPKGYKVIERTKRGDYMVTIVGTIECE